MTLDNETGGLGDEVSLLSTYLEIVDKNFNYVDSLELYTKPNDGIYQVEAGGLEVNKIDIVKHDKIAETYSSAGQKLFKFFEKNSGNGKIKLIPLGKNVIFDIRGLQRCLLGEKTMNRFVSYRMIDITGLALSMQIKGRLPEGMSLSLDSLVQHFNIKLPGNAHEAKYDAKATVAVYRKLLEMI